jgi:hypothetical protein
MGKPESCIVCLEDININNNDIYFNTCSHGKYCHKDCIIKCNYKCPLCRKTNINIINKEQYNMKIKTY